MVGQVTHTAPDWWVPLIASRLRMTPESYRAKLAAGLKRCAACKAWHPVSAFGTRKSKTDGLNNICREADRARAREGMRHLYARRKEASYAR